MNIVIVVSDTLRRDFLRCYGNSWMKTPYIDKFAQMSIIFSRAYLSSFATVPMRRDLFTGRYSFSYTPWSRLGEEEKVVLSEILNEAGYIMQLVADTPHPFREGMNYQRGFQGWIWIRGQENDRYITDEWR